MKNVIPIGLGTALFGTRVPKREAFEILNKFASLGGKIIDTANNYAYWLDNGRGGDSESVIGDWLKNEDRSEFTIMTKIGSNPANYDDSLEITGMANDVEGLSPEAVRRAVDKSLARLKTNYIDILLAHHDDPNTPLLDTWRAFSDLVTSGKVRKVGISNYRSDRVLELMKIIDDYSLAPVDVVQYQYSIIKPLIIDDSTKLVCLDKELKETLKTFLPDAMIFGYSPLRGGIFEKNVDAEWPLEYDSPQNRRRVEEIQTKARETGASPSAYVLKMIVDEGIIPVTSTSKIERLENNLKLIRPCSKSFFVQKTF